MKRIAAILTIAAILSLMLTTFVFADDITKEQAELYKNHIDEMQKFHTENGIPYGMGFGACGGGTYNNGSYGFGRGMMGIYPSK